MKYPYIFSKYFLCISDSIMLEFTHVRNLTLIRIMIVGNPSQFGRRLRAFRERKGLSQQKLAELANVQRVSISSVESGRQGSLSLPAALKVAAVLGITVDELARGDRLSGEE